MTENNWVEFWRSRVDKENPSSLRPFAKNYAIILATLITHFGSLDNLQTLEVGCGRGLLSHWLNQAGMVSFGMDIGDYIKYKDVKFYNQDIFHHKLDYRSFDMVMSYGLLEHFRYRDQMLAISKMIYLTKPGGLFIHYVVPNKWTNIQEDRNVYRDSCKGILDIFDVQWVYPIFKSLEWKTNKWFGKGFFITGTINEDLSTNYSQVC